MDEKELKKIVQIRAGHRSVVTKSIEKVSGIVSNYNFDQINKSKALESVVKEKIGVLKSLDETILEEPPWKI